MYLIIYATSEKTRPAKLLGRGENKIKPKWFAIPGLYDVGFGNCIVIILPHNKIVRNEKKKKMEYIVL